VGALAERLRLDLGQLPLDPLADFLAWAARLHEVGMSIAQGAYHKHSAYILAYADMPGFSRQEQGWLSNLVLAQRGKLSKMRAAFDDDPRLAELAFCLRIAVILYRSRRNLKLPAMRATFARDRTLRLNIEAAWLAQETLVALALDGERAQWNGVGWTLEIEEK
jgi:exopolyphosphatase/guanosine-5'-triphosphate,3'-diphosphate pyrophosphatase